jgi:DNA-binding response OmpR family regulator
MVHQSGGEVLIESAVGVGTTVTVLLRGAAAERGLTGPAAPPTSGGHERILLVEDEAALRAGTARILSEQGYQVLVAAGGDEALELFHRRHGAVDAVVTDVVMPRMRGDELARRLNERGPFVPVIFMSGYDSGDPSVNGRLGGRLLTKPVSQDTLLHALREVLDVRR